MSRRRLRVCSTAAARSARSSGIGSAIITVATFVVAMVLMLVVNATGTLRVSEAGELQGLDLHEHGISAYPEYQISPWAAPAGMPKH